MRGTENTEVNKTVYNLVYPLLIGQVEKNTFMYESEICSPKQNPLFYNKTVLIL